MRSHAFTAMSAFRLAPTLLALLAFAPFTVTASPGAPEAAQVTTDSDTIAWSRFTPAAMERDMSAALARAETDIARIADTPDKELSYERVIAAYSAATRRVGDAWAPYENLASVAETPARRAARNAVQPRLTAFFTAVMTNERLWRVIKAYSATPEAATLTPARRRHLDQVVRSFRDGGAELDAAGKARLVAVEDELDKLTRRFSENLLDATNAWSLLIRDERRLAGLPESVRAGALQAAKSRHLATDAQPAWLLTLQESSRMPVMIYADDASLRREAWEAWTRVAVGGDKANDRLIPLIVALRDERARLVGRANFADLTTADRMARNGATALAFVESMQARVKPAFDRECAELEAYAAKSRGGSAGPLDPWDFGYYTEKMRAERHGFDNETLRPYFSAASVNKGLFRLANTLFGVTVKGRDTVYVDPQSGKRTVRAAVAPGGEGRAPVEVWAPEVGFCELYDGERLLGRFYIDWFARAGKRSGAWMCPLAVGERLPGGGRAPHTGLIAGNFTPPLDGREPLLVHREVVTAFHEFGHLMHHLLSEAEVPDQSGTSVAWDFVETPSQLFENWAWRRESLNLFARHHETGEPIPEKLLSKMLAGRNYRAASILMRHLANSKMDLDLHTGRALTPGSSLNDYWGKSLAAWLPRSTRELPSPAPTFGHLFRAPVGYASGYYSYQWADVLQADAFGRFEKEGALNPATGRALREAILSKGDSEPAEKLLRDFLGREPNPDALLRSQGIL